jgi:hypothetical protein
MAFDENERIRQAQRLHEAVRQLRGRLLNSVAVIDISISRLLASYFCQDENKRHLAFSDVFTAYSMRLHSKAELLEKIVRNEFPWYLDREPDVFRSLRELREFRNTLAHATVDVSDEALAKGAEREIGFVYYRDGERRVRQVTPEMANDFNVKASMVHTSLIELGRLFGFVI